MTDKEEGHHLEVVTRGKWCGSCCKFCGNGPKFNYCLLFRRKLVFAGSAGFLRCSQCTAAVAYIQSRPEAFEGAHHA